MHSYTYQTSPLAKAACLVNSQTDCRLFSPCSQIIMFLFLVQKPLSAIAIQPTENHEADVGVFMMRLPGSENGFTPVGQMGVCCATALITRGQVTTQGPNFPTIRGTIVKRSSMVRTCCM